jgi:HAD superfamily hydrolase (TIGR01509 family)
VKNFKLPYFSAIIFDLDGLVLDTETTYLYAWQQAAKKMDYQLSDSFCSSLSGADATQVKKSLINYCGSNFDLTYFRQLSGECWFTYVQQYGIQKKKGFNHLLNIIKKHHIPYCLATNSPKKNARECLNFAGLRNEFDLIISRDQVKKGKPSPDIFLKAADYLQIPINRCLVLEDSIIGIKAAQQAGAYPLLIPSQPIIKNELLINERLIFKDLTEVSKIILANLPKN